jgi:hypothetical protein
MCRIQGSILRKCSHQSFAPTLRAILANITKDV